MSNALKMAAGTAVAAPLWVDEVMSCHTYTGNGTTQTITNGIDLAGEGGMVWIKFRSGAGSTQHHLVNSTQGASWYMMTNATPASQDSGTTEVTAFTSSGFSLGSGGSITNTNADKYASWSFRNADRFFSHASVVKSGGSNATASFPGLGTLGMVAVKRTDSTGSWYVWHRSLTAGKLLYLEQTAAEATLGHITVSGTTVTLVNGVIADGTYIVYAWAHDTEADGIVQCGSFTTDGSGNATVTLGWEPQWLLIKKINSTGPWYIKDIARGWTVNTNVYLEANTSVAEGNYGGGTYPTATGFQESISANDTYIYLAIRRPNKPPTVGTQVYNAIARTGTGAAATVTGVGFAPDLVIDHRRSAADEGQFFDRLRGPSKFLWSPTTDSEQTITDAVTSFDMDGVSLGADASWGKINFNGRDYINWFFRRAPGFMDEVCYTGTGAAHTEAHNLGVVPELMIIKGRSVVAGWPVYSSATGNTYYSLLNSTAAASNGADMWNNTTPTASVFSLSTQTAVNGNTYTYVAYLFATLAGISCVTSYTGNGGTADSAGTSQTINCGFTTGARFVMLKCTSHTSDWVIVDTVRGLVSGNDPALSLNTTAAEVTTTDLLDPDSSGFIVNQLATGTTSANFNVTGRTYIVLAVA